MRRIYVDKEMKGGEELTKKVGLLINNLDADGVDDLIRKLFKIIGKEYEIFIITLEKVLGTYEYEDKIIHLIVENTQDGIGKKLSLNFQTIKSLKHLKDSFDIVISFDNLSHIINSLAKIEHCKTITVLEDEVTINGKLFRNKKVNNTVLNYVYNNTDKIVTISKALEERLIKKHQISKDKICTIYIPYDAEEVLALAHEEIEPRHQEFMNSGIIFINREKVIYQKGIWHLIKAFKLVHDKIPDTKLVLLGEDYKNGHVQELVEQYKLQNSVLLAGYQENPYKYIKNSHVYVLSSIYEDFPSSLIDALTCGCAIIATDCKSGPREILYRNTNVNRESREIEQADYGLLIPRLNSIECWDKDKIDRTDYILAKAMIQIISQIELRAYYVREGIVRNEAFNFKVCKETFMEMIESL